MLTMLQGWQGKVMVGDTVYDTVRDLTADLFVDGHIDITLLSNTAAARKPVVAGDSTVSEPDKVKQYRITVKQYMTKKATEDFDFMLKWNKDVPMPLRTMTGIKVKETRGMVYMKLHGVGEPVICCMRCGRELTNPISRHYGIGPECLGKLGFACDIEDVDGIKKQLVDVTWEGWIIKSAITEEEEVI